jgi:FAD/FMN-containing dehydrogenase
VHIIKNMPRGVFRRTFLSAAALANAGIASAASVQTRAAHSLQIRNVTGLYTVEVARIAEPRSVAEVASHVKAWPGKVAVGGGRYSMGGQIAVQGGLHLDMRRLSGLVWLRPSERTVRVQAGMRWRDLQDHLDPLGLAVKTMQSYANFTVGGSVAVNAHGRYVGHGPVGNSVRALQLVLADGSVVEATREVNRELFRAAVGGYGIAAVITEVELDVVNNVRIERVVERVSLADYPHFFKSRVLADARAVLHNTDLLPPAFDAPVAVTWKQAAPSQPLTEHEQLVPRGAKYSLEQNAIWVMTEVPGGPKLRQSVVHPLLLSKPVVKWLNHEASLDVAELEPRTRAMSTFVLQEYFVPERHFLSFAEEMVRILRSRDVEALNVSIRHSPADRDSMLPWAAEDVFSFVLYYKQRTWTAAREEVGLWTRELIDAALRYGGRYYLPYQLHATTAQFEAAYPEIAALRRVKQRFDPSAKFSNELWRRYL